MPGQPRRRGRRLVRVRRRRRAIPVVSLSASSLFVQVKAELLQLEVILDKLLLLVVELSEFVLVSGDLLAHDARRVAAEPLPLARELAALLTIVVQETAEVAELLVVVAQTLVGFLQDAQLVYL